MMTLGNMRENGVRSLAITCGAVWCHHQALLDASDFAADVVVPSFGPRMVCTVCGAIGADARRPKYLENHGCGGRGASKTLVYRVHIARKPAEKGAAERMGKPAEVALS